MYTSGRLSPQVYNEYLLHPKSSPYGGATPNLHEIRGGVLPYLTLPYLTLPYLTLPYLTYLPTYLPTYLTLPTYLPT